MYVERSKSTYLNYLEMITAQNTSQLYLDANEEDIIERPKRENIHLSKSIRFFYHHLKSPGLIHLKGFPCCLFYYFPTII